MIRDRSFESSSFQSSSAPRTGQPREGHRELLHRTRRLPSLRRGGRLHQRRGKPRISTERSPTKSLSFSFTLCCNTSILGALEYKDHQLLDVGHQSAQTRINCCVLSVILVFLSPPEPPETHTLTPPRTTMLATVSTL